MESINVVIDKSILEISIDDDLEIEMNSKIEARPTYITNDTTNVATTDKTTSESEVIATD